MQYNATPFRVTARGTNIIKEDLLQANTNFQTIYRTLRPFPLPSVYDPNFEPPVGAVYEHIATLNQNNLHNLAVATIHLNLKLDRYGFELMVFPSNLEFKKFSFTLSSPEIKVEFPSPFTFGFYKCLKLNSFVVDQFEQDGIIVHRTYQIPTYSSPPFHLHFQQPALINSQQEAKIYIYLRRIA